MLTDHSRLEPSPSVVSARLGEEAVLFDAQRGIYYGLNEVGSRLWELLADRRSVGDAKAILTQEFDVTADLLHRDISAIVARWEELGLVRRTSDEP